MPRSRAVNFHTLILGFCKYTGLIPKRGPEGSPSNSEVARADL